MELTQARVRELFDYRDDGVLVRRTKQSIRTEIGQVIGTICATGYLVAHVDKKLYKVHRLIFLWHHGYLPPIVDHSDMDPLNNKIGNLRDASKSQNMANRREQSNNTSGFKGIWFHKQSGKWGASIKVKGKKIHLGLYLTELEAHAAYEKAARAYFGEFARAS